MSNLKERLQKIKDDYAKEYVYDSWKDLLFDCSTYGYKVADHMDEIFKRYAEEVIKEASNKARIMKNGNSGSYLDASVDKQSILNLIDEL